MNRKKVLFVTIPERGHINPMIGVAKFFSREDMDIAFFAQLDVSKQLLQAGIRCECYTPRQNGKPQNNSVAHGAEFAEKLKDKIWMQEWIKTLLIDCVPEQVYGLNEAFDAFEPEIIVSDPMVYATSIVAEIKNVPWVGISNSLNPLTPKDWHSDLVETLDLYEDERLALFSSASRVVDFRIADLVSPWLNIVFTSEAYVPRYLSENDFSFYVGLPFPLDGKRGDETAFPFEKLIKGKKKVYMSLGSMLYYHPILFKTVAEALEGLNVQLILSVGELFYEDFSKEFSDDTIV